MKVGFICFHSFVNPGGVKNHILGLSKEFEKRGIETKIIIPRRKFKENYGKNVIIMGMSLPFNIGGTQGDFCMNLNPFSIYKILKKEKFDILHFHNFVVPSAWQILEMQKSLKNPPCNILTFHANLDGMPLFRSVPYFSKIFVSKLNEKMDGVIGVADLILRLFRGYKKPMKVIANGIDLNQFNPNIEGYKRFDDGKINILFIGRIEERKGLIYLLEAYKLLQEKNDNIRLIIVGEGPLKKDCQQFVKCNDLTNVVFEGQGAGDTIAKYLNSSHIFCSPAIFGESFGIVLLEAMACKKPICGFSNLGYKELLQGTKGESFLAEPRDSAKLALILEKLIKNEKLRKEMGEWGYETAQNYSWEKIADQVLEFYGQCKNRID
ncbi:MAG TPA: glycosyltransferase family 4 protein [Candidatus Pacearchaeota archaeon]|nr:glycosyltransferase family 4 protein [Candidatus Pacearchaeota archaeon]